MTQDATRKRISGDEAWAVAAAEYERMVDLVGSLGGEDWGRPTDCTAWDVRGMLGHLVGAAEGWANPLELAHQYWVGWALIRRHEVDGHLPVDGANAVQVRERAGATTAGLVSRYRHAIPGALRWRRRLRWIPISMNDDGGRFRMRELFEVILTRDTWMHRVDIARATGGGMLLTPEHDGRIIEDCVLDWASKHSRPFRLALTGPAGGRFAVGVGGPEMEVDAVEFVRALSGRGTREETLGTRVVF